MEDMVCLTVTHGNFKAGSPMMGKVSWGWPRVLSSMKSFLETGRDRTVVRRVIKESRVMKFERAK